MKKLIAMVMMLLLIMTSVMAGTIKTPYHQRPPICHRGYCYQVNINIDADTLDGMTVEEIIEAGYYDDSWIESEFNSVNEELDEQEAKDNQLQKQINQAKKVDKKQNKAIDENSDDIADNSQSIKKNSIVNKMQTSAIRYGYGLINDNQNDIDTIKTLDAVYRAGDGKGTSMTSVKKFLFADFWNMITEKFSTKADNYALSKRIDALEKQTFGESQSDKDLQQAMISGEHGGWSCTGPVNETMCIKSVPN